VIRRWSCLITLNNNFNSFDFFKKNHKINLFKSSVKFKRFSRKNTRFKRKSLIKFKHQSNWLIYTNVIKFWIKDYIFNKNYIKYQFFNKIFINNFYFYNFNFIKNRNEGSFYNFNFYFSIFTKKGYVYFTNKTLIKNSPICIAWFLSNANINNSVIPAFTTWENTSYTHNTNKNLDFDIINFLNFAHNLILKKIVEFRKILIILYLYNINFKKVK
jgi:hypothetical protein